MKKLVSALICCFAINIAISQIITDTLKLHEIIKAKDSLLFNIGFNNCDISQFEKLISADFEFYDDAGGAIINKAGFIANARNRLCRINYKYSRELVNKSLKVHPIEENDVVVGAIQTGKHKFYAKEINKRRKHISTEKFIYVWLLENGDWKLSRAFSYDKI